MTVEAAQILVDGAFNIVMMILLAYVLFRW